MGMASKAGPSIEGRRNGPGEPVAGSGTDEFDPFYERLARRLPNVLMPKVSLPLAMALAYYTLHLRVVGSGAAALYPELLSLLIFALPSLLYLATATFYDLADQMDNRVGTGRPPAYGATLRRLLSDRRFLLAAALFGLVNVAAAMVLGLNLETTSQMLVVIVGYFLAGALAGLALWAMIGIVRTIRAYVREDRPRYDVTAPDGCGGMLFLGSAITTLGILTLIAGVLISSYLLLAEGQAHGGQGHEGTGWETILLWSLVALPYALSVLVLLAPTFEIHAGLHAYKVDEDRRIEELLGRLEAALDAAGADVDTFKALHFRRDDAREHRKMLYAMSSWPFSVKTNLNYTFFMALSAVWSIFSEDVINLVKSFTVERLGGS